MLLKKKMAVSFVVALSLLLSLALAACGDSTATPAPTATPVPAAPNISGVSLGGISGLQEITIDAALLGDSLKQLPGAAIKIYVSDDTMDKVASTLDAAAIKAGFVFAMPGETKPTKQGDAIGAFYAKGETSDMLFAVTPVTEDPSALATQLNVPGLSADGVKKMVDQMKGKKTIVVILTTPGVMSAMFKGFADMGATPTPTK
ncbi:hypothetical protein [Candidatus Chlorohelix sp.]|uniref:hypothetical protein n=1 Tax=Candidatus Chlorohelix sp. TaxID=3139201 RepID=UPI003045ECA0